MILGKLRVFTCGLEFGAILGASLEVREFRAKSGTLFCGNLGQNQGFSLRHGILGQI